MIVVIDYNVGNIKSVCNAFGHIGCEVKLSREPQVIEDASGLVLPGVAAFGYAISILGSLDELIKKVALNAKPLLGICVGFQMLFDQSSEYGQHKGLGLVKGNIVSIPSGRTIPHMSWNLVKLPADMDLFSGLGKEEHFYFAHSFYANITDLPIQIMVLICQLQYRRQIYTAYNFTPKKVAKLAQKFCRILLKFVEGETPDADEKNHSLP